MCCVISSFFFLGPRAAVIIWWLINPARLNMAFSNIFLLIAGTLFLPLTTLTYAVVFPQGLFGLDWLWLAIAAMVDLSLYGGGIFSRRNR